MTDQAFKKQIDDIRRVTAEVVKSRESARKFLLDHGIIKQHKLSKTSSKEKK